MKGFTLIETLIVVSISTVMMVVLGILIYNFNKTFSYQEALIESSGSASALMREVESLTLPASAVLHEHIFSTQTYTSTTTTLVLEIPSIDSSGNVISNTYDYAVFYPIGTNVYRLIETNELSGRNSGIKQLSSSVSEIIFTYNDTDFTKVSVVTVDVKTQTSVKQEILSDHRVEQIRLRNY